MDFALTDAQTDFVAAIRDFAKRECGTQEQRAYDMERLVRQTLVSTIYGGTSEIQRNIIAKTLGL